MKYINKTFQLLTLPSLFIAALFLTALVLGGCQQYSNHYDGVTSHAGDHLAANEARLVVDPWNPAANNRQIEGNSNRLEKAIKRLESGTEVKLDNSHGTSGNF